MKPIYSLFIMLSFAGQLRAQNDTTELFPYGDMNQWMVRVVDESLLSEEIQNICMRSHRAIR